VDDRKRFQGDADKTWSQVLLHFWEALKYSDHLQSAFAYEAISVLGQHFICYQTSGRYTFWLEVSFCTRIVYTWWQSHLRAHC